MVIADAVIIFGVDIVLLKVCKTPKRWFIHCLIPLFIQSVISASRRGQNKYGFTFDRVFQPTCSQADVFEEISQLVQVSEFALSSIIFVSHKICLEHCHITCYISLSCFLISYFTVSENIVLSGENIGGCVLIKIMES